MTLQERIQVLSALGSRLSAPDEYLEAIIHRSSFHNPWFTKENQHKAIRAIATRMLQPELLAQWLSAYEMPLAPVSRKVGLVMAGNIPLVGWHDIQCVFIAGHQALIKLSDKDPYLLPYLFRLMADIDKRTEPYFQLLEKLTGFDAVIATGSNNTARYFEQYFGKYPNIIRRNRNAVAVLSGRETGKELHALGEDIFRFFGLGCRNVAKVYVPRNYDFKPLLESLHEYRDIVLHDKYKNNFDYNFALYSMNRTPIHMSGSIMLVENPGFSSRIASLHYEFYDNLSELEQSLMLQTDQIQCVVATPGLLTLDSLPFGKAQEPALRDYADGVDTLDFLLQLSAD
jgi:hypothetical protein